MTGADQLIPLNGLAAQPAEDHPPVGNPHKKRLREPCGKQENSSHQNPYHQEREPQCSGPVCPGSDKR